MDSGEPSFTKAEWKLMSVMWDLEVANAAAVAKRLRERFGILYTVNTTGTLLARLEKKGFLRSALTNRAGRGRPGYAYSPTISREQGISAQFRKFLADRAITPEEAEMLKAALDQAIRIRDMNEDPQLQEAFARYETAQEAFISAGEVLTRNMAQAIQVARNTLQRVRAQKKRAERLARLKEREEANTPEAPVRDR